MGDIRPGITGEAKDRVTEANTAQAYGSGQVNVYATPAMIGLMENAALKSVEPLLDEGTTTVGMSVNIKHLAPTLIGMAVTANTVLKEVDGRRLLFSVEAFDEKGKIGEGLHERFIINLNKFLTKLENK